MSTRQGTLRSQTACSLTPLTFFICDCLLEKHQHCICVCVCVWGCQLSRNAFGSGWCKNAHWLRKYRRKLTPVHVFSHTGSTQSQSSSSKRVSSYSNYSVIGDVEQHLPSLHFFPLSTLALFSCVINLYSSLSSPSFMFCQQWGSSMCRKWFVSNFAFQASSSCHSKCEVWIRRVSSSVFCWNFWIAWKWLESKCFHHHSFSGENKSRAENLLMHMSAELI